MSTNFGWTETEATSSEKSRHKFGFELHVPSNTFGAFQRFAVVFAIAPLACVRAMMANAAAAAAIAPPPPPPKAAAPFPPLPSENPDEEGALGLPPLPAPPPIIPEAPTRLEQTKVPLAWTAAKVGPAVNISGDGATASRSASGCGAQLTSEWMQGGRHPHIYHIVLALDEVMPETMIGIVGKNFWPSDWSEPLAKSLHSIVLECGTGKFFVKGKATSFMLKPLTSGARLHMMLDMQVQEMTLELLGTSPGQILSSVTIEAVPAEVTLVVASARADRRACVWSHAPRSCPR